MSFLSMAVSLTGLSPISSPMLANLCSNSAVLNLSLSEASSTEL